MLFAIKFPGRLLLEELLGAIGNLVALYLATYGGAPKALTAF